MFTAFGMGPADVRLAAHETCEFKTGHGCGMKVRPKGDDSFLPGVLFKGVSPRVASLMKAMKTATGKASQINPQHLQLARRLVMPTVPDHGLSWLVSKHVGASSGGSVVDVESLLRERMCLHDGIELGSAIWCRDGAIGDYAGTDQVKANKQIKACAPSEWINVWKWLTAVPSRTIKGAYQYVIAAYVRELSRITVDCVGAPYEYCTDDTVEGRHLPANLRW